MQSTAQHELFALFDGFVLLADSSAGTYGSCSLCAV